MSCCQGMGTTAAELLQRYTGWSPDALQQEIARQQSLLEVARAAQRALPAGALIGSGDGFVFQQGDAQQAINAAQAALRQVQSGISTQSLLVPALLIGGLILGAVLLTR